MSRSSRIKPCFIFLSGLSTIALLIVVSSVLLPSYAYAIEPSASPPYGPFPGGPWFTDGGLHDLYGMYPNLKNDTNVTGFIDTYGFKGWFQKVAYEELDNNKRIKLFYRYACLEPANNNSILLVVLINESVAREDKAAVWTRIINASEELPSLTADDIQNLTRNMTRSFLSGNETDQNVTSLPDNTGNRNASPIPGFTVLVAVASVLLVILCKKKYR